MGIILKFNFITMMKFTILLSALALVNAETDCTPNQIAAKIAEIGGLSCPSVTNPCAPGELPEYKVADDCCNSCVFSLDGIGDILSELSGCSLEEFATCADSYDSLRECGNDEFPTYSDCCLSCKFGACGEASLENAATAWTNAPECGANEMPEFDRATCSPACRFAQLTEEQIAAIAANADAYDEYCTAEKFAECREAAPTCAGGV